MTEQRQITREQSWSHAAFASLERAREAASRPPQVSIGLSWRFRNWRVWFRHHGWPGGWTYHLGPVKIRVQTYDHNYVDAPFQEHEKRMVSR